MITLRHGQPTIEGTDRSVAEVVRAAYELGMDAAGALCAVPDQALAALSHCAERQCDAAAQRCQGCTLRAKQDGIGTLDAFCARFAEVVVADSGLRIAGQGAGTHTIASMAELYRTWEGEEYWFWARRVLRRLKHKQVRAGKLRLSEDAGDAPVFVLVAPQMADNIGMVARAMANFALQELRLVAPRDGWPNDKARFAASGAHPVIDAAQSFPTLRAAIGDLNWVCATTARPRHLAKPVFTPDEAVAEMVRRTAAGERCGVLFGPERAGLTTDDVANADAMVMVRVNPDFASLNLAQAVLLMGYEWVRQTGKGAIGRHTTMEGVLQTGLQGGSPPATKAELQAFFDHLEEELSRAGHFKPPEKRQTMVRNLRSMFERMGATQQEVRTLRGIVVSLSRSRHRDGGG